MIPTTIDTALVSNLEFIRISEDIRPVQWVEWEVRFSYQGTDCEGFLQACPFRPNLMADSVIERCVKA